MHLDPVLLSRIQFAWVVAWHFLLPAFTVGLASFIAVLEGLHLATGQEIYFRISTFWIKIFAVSFGMGVVSGITMPFQFGTNWSRFSDDVANIVSPLLAYEGLTAFFLEAAFLGVLLFGRKLVPRWAHFFAALMVALGTLASTFWILSTNSWMQTPAGYEMADGRFMPKDWLAIVFNPSFPYRLAHTVVAVYITTAFVVAGVGAAWLRRERFVLEARTMLSMALWLLTVLVPLQAFLGDAHGLNTLEYQPAKLAAIEGIWNGGSRLPWAVFAIPDDKAATNRYELSIPYAGSLILTHDINGTVKGLKDFPPQDRPPVAFPFFGFRIMFAVWGLMLLVVALSWWLRFRDALYDSGWFLRLCTLASPLGIYRRVGRLGDDRGRPTALDGVRAPAHRGFGIAVADRRGCRGLLRRLRHRLCRHVRRRRRAHDANRAARPDRTGDRAGRHRGRTAARAGRSGAAQGR